MKPLIIILYLNNGYRYILSLHHKSQIFCIQHLDISPFKYTYRIPRLDIDYIDIVFLTFNIVRRYSVTAGQDSQDV